MKPSFDLLLLRFGESTFHISVVYQSGTLMSLAINIDTYIGALLTEITYHGTPVDDSKATLHHKKYVLSLIYLFLIAFLNQRLAFLLTFEKNPQCTKLFNVCVFSDAYFALMLWDQQVDTGDGLIAPYQNLDKSFFSLLLSQILDFILASLLAYPYYLECFPT